MQKLNFAFRLVLNVRVITLFSPKMGALSPWAGDLPLNGWLMINGKNATWRWQWAHLVICTCDMHFLRQDLLKSHMETYEFYSSLNFFYRQTNRQTDRQTDRRTESDAYEKINGAQLWSQHMTEGILSWFSAKSRTRLFFSNKLTQYMYMSAGKGG